MMLSNGMGAISKNTGLAMWFPSTMTGEFSVAVWAPGGAAYLDDLVSIFEEYGWDWTYHAFREWEGWSLEHEGTPEVELFPAGGVIL